ncbi:MAG: DUF441 domain-containing protein [Caldibacillus debilis]|jgi:uncharacterized membrane protein (DUF441 family)|uniref:UPF0756 membrane protein Cdeb_02910 n=2 Tax=Caldibacillus debilis TaxID=301148 RepID=A0A420VIH2_9BACI|nr:DUF441 domain-containing protein [Caldibacillus debilis]MBO2481116.1 DUF441 domain-containing protein [Bacillaceae bacterium]REJ24769.1 MAG: DUF441 domain-containing protein [Caldibacillus debilis]REJ31410.1 MAG: DUF441 domain-containing protein [Caldibacillus debilis]RKO63464.1 putative membrane protein [Caldibacillus debilis GB1]
MTYLFLLLFLAAGVFAKNQPLILAVLFLLFVKILFPGGRIFAILQEKGIDWGITIITVAVLVPVATGEIGFQELIGPLKSVNGVIALLSGVLVALLAKAGVAQLAEDPAMMAAIVFGTILGLSFFNGVAVGPMIGAGIAWLAIKLFEYLQ